MQTDEINVIQFLTEEYERGLPFNYLSGYISALKNYLPNHMLNANVVKNLTRVYSNSGPKRLNIILYGM